MQINKEKIAMSAENSKMTNDLITERIKVIDDLLKQNAGERRKAQYER